MTHDGWRALVLKVVSDHHGGDLTGLDLLARLLTEQDAAKQSLRDKGYSWTGLDWPGTVDQIPDGWR